MADSIIQLPADGTGKKLDTEQLTVGANVVERERGQIAGAAANDIAVVTDTDPAAADHGLVTRQAPPVAPKVDVRSSVALAAAGAVDLSSSDMASGKTGKLDRIEVFSTVPIKAEFKTVADGVETLRAVRIGWRGEIIFNTPHKDYIKQAYSATAGSDAFRVRVTNLDPSKAADVYATFFYDEVG